VRYVDLLDSYMAQGGLCHPSDNFGTIPCSGRIRRGIRRGIHAGTRRSL
jgi:hypothetical protein